MPSSSGGPHLICLEVIAIGAIVLLRVNQDPIARHLHARGLSPVVAIRASRVILLASVLLPWIMLLVAGWINVAILRRIRWKLDRCLRCNYDLTGNTRGVCPECGTPLEPSLWPIQQPEKMSQKNESLEAKRFNAS